MVSTARALQRHADSLDRDTPNGRLIHWLEEAFDDGTFIMRQEGPEGRAFFRGTFTVDGESGDVEVNEEFTEVAERRDFVDLENNSQEEEEDMSTASNTKEELVASLIACDRTHFDDSHQEALMAMDEDTLNSLKAVEVEAEVEEEAPAAAAAEVPAEEEPAPAPEGLTEYLSQAPAEHQDELKEAIKLNEARRTEMTADILAVEGCQFNEAQLKDKSLTELTAIHGLIPKSEEAGGVENLGSPMGRPVDFSGRINGSPETNEGDELGTPMGRVVSLAAKKSA